MQFMDNFQYESNQHVFFQLQKLKVHKFVYKLNVESKSENSLLSIKTWKVYWSKYWQCTTFATQYWCFVTFHISTEWYSGLARVLSSPFIG